MRRTFRQVPPAVWVVAALAGVGAALAGGQPVGQPIVDLLLRSTFAVLVVLAGAHAPWWTVFWAGAVVVAAGGSPARQVLGGFVVATVVVLDRRGRLEPSAAALLTAAVVQVVLRLPTSGRLGTSALLAALATVPLLVGGRRRLPSVLRGPARWVGLAAAALAVWAVATGVWVAVAARADLVAAQREVTAGVEAAQIGDSDGAADGFRSASARFATVENRTAAWWAAPGRVVPVLAQHLRALHDAAAVGGDGARLALASTAAVDPERLRLVDGRIDPDAVAAVAPVFRRLAAEADALQERAGGIGSPWLVGPVRDRLADLEVSIGRARTSARTAEQVAAVAPAILGGEGRRTYLLAFVTPAEARASGGFLGTYGILEVDDGRLDLTRVGRNDELDAAGDPATKVLTGPADYLAGYARFDPAHTWANVTMSPDFPSVAQAMAELFPQSGGVPVDGVLRLDPTAMAALLELTGPVTVAGLEAPLDADNAAAYLLAEQYARFDDHARRSDLLGEVAEVAFDQLTSGTGAAPARMGAALGPALAGGNLAVWLRDPSEQQVVAHLGIDDALPPADDGAAFGVTTQNAGGNKVDVFLQRSVQVRTVVDAGTGLSATEATVELRNDAPAGGYADYVIGNLVGLPPGTNRSYVSMFATGRLTSITLDGASLPVATHQEHGYGVASAFVDLPPGTSRTIVATYDDVVELRAGHRFRYLPQVMVHPDRVDWSLEVVGAVLGEVATRGGGEGGAVEVDDRRVRVRHRASVGPWSVDVPLRPGRTDG